MKRLVACMAVLTCGCTTTSYTTGATSVPTTPSSAPGEEVFLAHQPGSGRPFRLGDTDVFDACTVLPASAVREAGIELDPYHQVRRDVMERDAPGDPSLAKRNLEGLANCTWPGVDDQHVILQIFQPPYSHDRDRTSRLEFLSRKGAKARTVGGLETYTVHGKNGDPQDWQVSIFAEHYWALLLAKTTKDSYRAGSPQDLINTLVDGITQNLNRGPTAPSTFSYTGLYADAPDPCTLFTREDFRQTYGVDDIGRITVGLTGGDQPLQGDNGEQARYIRLTCSRKALGKTFADPDAPGLEIELNVFPDAEQASLGEYGQCDPQSSATKVFGPPHPIATKIGDGRVCMPNVGRDNRRLVFRVGRTLVFLHNWLYPDARDLDALAALAAKLTPIAQTIATRLNA